MNRSLQVFVACAVGAGIGTLVTLQLQSYFWWIGLIVGGVIGYLSYDPKQVLAAIKIAWQEVLAAVKIAWQEAINYKPDKERAFDSLWGTLAVSSVLISCIWILVTVFGGAMYFGWAPRFLSQLSEASVGTILTVCALITFTISYIGFCVLTVIFTLWDDDLDKLVVTRRSNKRVCYRVNPITVSIYWPVRIAIVTTIFLWNYTPTAVRIALKFTKIVFIAIHSQERLLCGIDAVIGAAIGFYFGNPIIGALAGGIVGILNFEIVSRRILHLSFENN